MTAFCPQCQRRHGVGLCPDVTVTHDGPPMVTPARGQHVIVLDDLTTDEVRVITGLVRAMRESERRGIVSGRCEGLGCDYDEAEYEVTTAAVDTIPGRQRIRLSAAAWHIAHAISLMGEP